jgi:hypothetical protein
MRSTDHARRPRNPSSFGAWESVYEMPGVPREVTMFPSPAARSWLWVALYLYLALTAGVD